MSIADSFAPPGAPAWHQAGTVGVDIFFVVSGFIIARIAFIDRSPEAVSFLRNRWLRVVPIYWLATAAWLVSGQAGRVGAPNLIATVAFWPAAAAKTALPIFPYGWTLCFEMLFYLAAAVVLASPRRGAAFAGLLAAWLACVGLRHSGQATAALSFLGNPIAAEFLAGVAIAYLPRRSPWLGALALIAAAAIFSATAQVPRVNDGHMVFDASLSSHRLLAFGIPAALAVFAALQFEPRFRTRTGEALAYLGDASYALYLSHPLTFALLWRLSRTLHLSGLAIVGLGLVMAVAAAVAVHEWVEKPLLRMVRPKPGPVLAPAWRTLA